MTSYVTSNERLTLIASIYGVGRGLVSGMSCAVYVKVFLDVSKREKRYTF